MPTEHNILIVAEENEAATELFSGLARNGFTCSINSGGKGIIEQVIEQSPDLVLVAMDSHSRIGEVSQGIKQARPLPVMALVRLETLDSLDGHLDVDDFVIEPCDVRELALRIKRLLKNNGNTDSSQLIRCGDLVIDLTKCEASIGGRLVILTFREYELLKFLARNRGRVFTREALLNKVWGYHYYGGDRTVDVHIRRLRSKIEDSNHSFIETMRNIGYRFKEDKWL
jgi:DNA-binding response OmpR family regulator